MFVYLIDEVNHVVTFIPSSSHFSYKFQYVHDMGGANVRLGGETCGKSVHYLFIYLLFVCLFICLFRITLSVTDSGTDCVPPVGVVHPKRVWLQSVLLPKICHWAESPLTTPTSNNEVISMKRYTSLYKELKEKYGPPLVKVFKVIYLFIKVVVVRFGLRQLILISLCMKTSP